MSGFGSGSRLVSIGFVSGARLVRVRFSGSYLGSWFASISRLGAYLNSCLVRVCARGRFGTASGPVRIWVRGEFVSDLYSIMIDLYLDLYLDSWIIHIRYIIYFIFRLYFCKNITVSL